MFICGPFIGKNWELAMVFAQGGWTPQIVVYGYIFILFVCFLGDSLGVCCLWRYLFVKDYLTYNELTLVPSLLSNRLDTIMDSDRVLVMHAGRVVEFDSPSALRKKAIPYFRTFSVEETND